MHDVLLGQQQRCCLASVDPPQDAERAFRGLPRSMVAWNTALAAYARRGQLQSARAFFDLLPQRDAVSWNTMLAALARLAGPQEAARFFSSIPSPDLVSWNTMLAANAGSTAAAERIFAAMPQRDLISWNTLLACLCRTAPSLEKIHGFFSWMMPEHDLVSANAVLSAEARLGRSSLELFSAMRERSLVSYTAVLMSYIRAGEIRQAAAFFTQQMPEHDVVCCNALISGAARLGYLRLATSVFDAMACKDEVSMAAIATGYAQNGQLLQAEAIVEKQCKQGLASTTAWNSVLTGYARAGRLDDARELLLHRMPTHSLASWNTLLAAHAQLGCADQALAILQEMPELDLMSWNSLLQALASSGDLNAVSRALDEVPQKDIFSWTTALAAYAQLGHSDEAWTIFSCMPEHDIVAWNAMLSALHSVQDARAFFHAMPCRNEASWNTMLSSCARRGDAAAARDIFERIPIFEEGTTICCTAMLTACAQAGACDTCLQGFREIVAMGNDALLDEACFTVALISCSRWGQIDAAAHLFASMIHDFSRQPSPRHHCCLRDALARCGA